MKNTLTTAVYVILAIAVIYVSLFFLSCNKKENSNSSPQATSCSATKAGVENIGIFPADNPWNTDISNDGVDFDISSYSVTNQVILRAMKKYGLILANIGSKKYISGAPDERWSNDKLRQLLQVKASDFEVVKFNN